MAQVTITLHDTPSGGVAVRTTFAPAVGAPCTPAQAAALEIFNRTRKDWGIKPPARFGAGERRVSLAPEPGKPEGAVAHHPV